MKKKKLAFLLSYRISDNDLKNLNLHYLKKFYSLRFLDISTLSLSKKILNIRKENKFNNLKYRSVKSINVLKQNLSAVDYVLDLNQTLLLDKKLNFFFKKKYNNIKIIGRLAGALPNFFTHNFVQKVYFLKKFFQFLIKYGKYFFILKSLAKYLKLKYYSKKKNIRYSFKYDYILIDSDLHEKKAKDSFSLSKKIFVHYKDYERFLINKNINPPSKNYAIFLDEALFNHPDDYELGFEGSDLSRKIIDSYFKQMNSFFEAFEKETNTKIVIAGHPKSLGTNYKKYFGKRKFFKNCTFELIKNSKLVFAHSSTSVGCAVILKKPLVFLSSNLMVDIGIFTRILSMSVETKSRLIDINNLKQNFRSFFLQDFSSYNHYLKKFLKSSKSKKRSYWFSLNTEIKRYEKMEIKYFKNG